MSACRLRAPPRTATQHSPPARRHTHPAASKLPVSCSQWLVLIPIGCFSATFVFLLVLHLQPTHHSVVSVTSWPPSNITSPLYHTQPGLTLSGSWVASELLSFSCQSHTYRPIRQRPGQPILHSVSHFYTKFLPLVAVADGSQSRTQRRVGCHAVKFVLFIHSFYTLNRCRYNVGKVQNFSLTCVYTVS